MTNSMLQGKVQTQIQLFPLKHIDPELFKIMNVFTLKVHNNAIKCKDPLFNIGH